MAVRVLETGKSVVGTHNAYEDAGGAGGKAIYITSFESSQLEDLQNSNVTYDLRVGGRYSILGSSRERQLQAGQAFEVHGGQAVLIETLENLHLPAEVFGLVVSKVSLAQKGLANISTKVDPGYQGQLIVSVTNTSKQPIVFEHGQAFCSIVFFSVEKPARMYSKGAKHISLEQGLDWFTRGTEWLEGRGVAVNLLLVVATAFAVAASIFSTIVALSAR